MGTVEMKRIIIVLIILIFLLIGISYIFRNTDDPSSILIISYNEKELPISDLTEFGATEIVTKRDETFRAYALQEILLQINVNEKIFNKLLFRSSDGGSLAIDATELEDLYLVMDSKNNERYLRLIIPADDFPQRWLKYINRVELVNDQDQ
jgi:hypothetical protein